MNLYFNYAILITIILVITGRYIYLRWLKKTTVVKIQIQGYAGLPPLIWCYNAAGEMINVVKCEGWQVLKLGKVTVEIKNNKITKIS